MNKIVRGILLIAALAIHSAGVTEANPEKADLHTKQDIREFLLEVTDTNPDQTEITGLIEELGSSSYADRVRAERSLMNRTVPLGLLKKASKYSNLERASRAARILELAGPIKKQRILQALQTVEEGAISGLSREVMDVMVENRKPNEEIDGLRSEELRTSVISFLNF